MISSIGKTATATTYCVNAVTLKRPRSVSANKPAITANAPRVGVIIVAAPPAKPARITHESRCVSIQMSDPNSADIQNRVVNQWWLTCVHSPCDVTRKTTTPTAETNVLHDTRRATEYKTQAIPTKVKVASTRAEKRETLVNPNQPAVKRNPPGGR